MIKPLALMLCALTLTGCATLSKGKAPSCSGYEQRPLNRSMWDWQSQQPTTGPTHVPPPADPKNPELGAAEGQVRTARFDEAGSLKRCGVV
jgi:type IV secretion system protein VirB7